MSESFVGDASMCQWKNSVLHFFFIHFFSIRVRKGGERENLPKNNKTRVERLKTPNKIQRLQIGHFRELYTSKRGNSEIKGRKRLRQKIQTSENVLTQD